MDQISEIILKLKMSELETQLALRECERVSLNRTIDDPKTDEDERYLTTIRRDRTIIEWGAIMTELQELRERRERDLVIAPRADLN